jgi:hypothetical protein
MSSSEIVEASTNNVAELPPVAEVNVEEKSALQLLFEKADGTFPTIVMVCIGLRNEEGPFLNLDEDPWKSLQNCRRDNKRMRKLFKPTLESLKGHVVWRWEHLCNGTLPKPRPNQWTSVKVHEWLEQHPIHEPGDVSFLTTLLKSEEALGYASLQRTQSENDSLARNWTGEIPYLRMIHCLVDDDNIKDAFLHRNDLSGDRIELDNRNSSERRQQTVWEMIAHKWNDRSFNPSTLELTDLHSHFFLPIDLSYREVAELSPATPEKCQSKFSSLVVQLNRRIAAWEQSGQGDGGAIHDDDEDEEENEERPSFGSFQNRTAGALDERHAFFANEQQYLLYLWVMLEKHDLLGCSLQRLNDDVSAGNGAAGVPSIVRGVASASRASLSVSVNEEAETLKEIHEIKRIIMQTTKLEGQISFRHSIENFEKEIRELEGRAFEARRDEEAVRFYNHQKETMEVQLRDMRERLQKLNRSFTYVRPTSAEGLNRAFASVPPTSAEDDGHDQTPRRRTPRRKRVRDDSSADHSYSSSSGND